MVKYQGIVACFILLGITAVHSHLPEDERTYREAAGNGVLHRQDWREMGKMRVARHTPDPNRPSGWASVPDMERTYHAQNRQIIMRQISPQTRLNLRPEDIQRHHDRINQEYWARFQERQRQLERASRDNGWRRRY